jgi:hypothetical protein
MATISFTVRDTGVAADVSAGGGLFGGAVAADGPGASVFEDNIGGEAMVIKIPV